MMKRSLHTQAGIALPITLVILLVMLISSIYLLKSSNTTTLTASNLAYDSAQSRAVDYGLHQGFQWLSATARTSKTLLDAGSTANGYNAFYDGIRTNPNAPGTVAHKEWELGSKAFDHDFEW